MLVDDDRSLIRLLETRLKSRGYDILTACDGKEGLEKAQTLQPDLIILDVMMPKVNGYTVCCMLRLDERYSSIPIIMLTSRSEDADKEFDEKVKPDAYITKPFNRDALFEKIEELVGE